MRFAVSVSWSVKGVVEVNANSEQEAIELVESIPLDMIPNDYINDSYQTDRVELVGKELFV